MADLTIGTMTDLTALVRIPVVAGETVTAGQPGYKKASDGRYWKALNTALASAAAAGVFTTGGNAGDTVNLATGGDIDLAVQPTVGAAYYVSANAGGICPVADVASGHYVTFLGIGKP